MKIFTMLLFVLFLSSPCFCKAGKGQVFRLTQAQMDSLMSVSVFKEYKGVDKIIISLPNNETECPFTQKVIESLSDWAPSFQEKIVQTYPPSKLEGSVAQAAIFNELCRHVCVIVERENQVFVPEWQIGKAKNETELERENIRLSGLFVKDIEKFVQSVLANPQAKK